jgi:4-amino-4-deoxy-L-arabinose transferase-like glycosyltransferase
LELRRLGDLGVARPLKLRWALAALAGLTLLRLVLAAWLPLSPDEAYYWVWSRALASGYLDHPPMVAYWIWAGTRLVGETALGVRLLGPLAAAGGSLLLGQAAEDFWPGKGAGLIAAALLNATLLFGAGSVIMTPDTPLLFFWTATICALGRLLRTGRGEWWLAAGLAAGLAMASKYTALLLVLSVGIWLLLMPRPRRWLATAWPWTGLALTMLLFAPVLAWNASHGFASFIKQGGRIADWHGGAAARFLAELVFGQMGLATPGVFVLVIAGGVLMARHALRPAAPACEWQPTAGAALLALLLVVPAAVFVEHALADRVQANWPAVLYPAGAVAASRLQGSWQRWFAPSVGLGLALTCLVYIQALAAPLPLPARLDPSLTRLAGWRQWAEAIEAERKERGAAFVAAESYGLAAELAWLLPRDVPVLGIGPRWTFFALPDGRALWQHRPGLLLAPSAQAETAPFAGIVTRRRGAEVAETDALFLAGGSEANLPVRLLPRRGNPSIPPLGLASHTGSGYFPE